ncbi:Hypothetical protein A7982_02374 [Minicystis rosea]|nr:Hypothetical protein A7982_02374 [Minicystis rosea]
MHRMRTTKSKEPNRSPAVLLILGGLLMATEACTGGGGGGSGGAGGGGSVSSGATSASGTGGSSTVSSSSSSSGGTPCANVLQGSFTIQNANDITAVAAYCEITGDLQIASSGLADITLPTLTKIGGQLDLKPNGLDKLSLPALVTIGSRFLSWSGHMNELDVPSLVSVNSIELPLTLTTLNAPKLASVPGGMNMVFASTSTISFPALVSVGQVGGAGSEIAFHVRGGASLSAPLLSDCKYVALGGQTGSIDLPALTSLEIFGNCFTSEDCATGTSPTIVMNALTSITRVELLAPSSPSVSLPNLTSIGSGTISASSFAAPKLTTFGDAAKASAIASVSMVDLGALTTVHNLTVKSTSLAALDLPELVSGTIAFGAQSCPIVSDPCTTNPLLVHINAPK